MVEMALVRLAVHARTREPLAVLLEVVDGEPTDRCVVVALRPAQAEVVSLGARPERGDDDRLTQDLVADVLGALGRRLVRAAVTDLVDERFRAELVLDDGTVVPARPSDVLAVAVRDGVPLDVADHVVAAAGQSYAALAPPAEGESAVEHEQVREMRRLLEDATAEDFRPGQGSVGPGEDG